MSNLPEELIRKCAELGRGDDDALDAALRAAEAALEWAGSLVCQECGRTDEEHESRNPRECPFHVAGGTRITRAGCPEVISFVTDEASSSFTVTTTDRRGNMYPRDE